jgi:hypothetical protein
MPDRLLIFSMLLVDSAKCLQEGETDGFICRVLGQLPV